MTKLIKIYADTIFSFSNQQANLRVSAAKMDFYFAEKPKYEVVWYTRETESIAVFIGWNNSIAGFTR